MRDPRETVRQGYNDMSALYLAERSRESEDVHLIEELIQRLPEGARVLDAGCGAGVPIARRLSEKFDVIGVDFAEAQVALARELVPGARFECQDLLQLDFPDATFDAICSYYTIIHIPREEHEGLLQKFYQLLKPTGLALLCLGADDLADDRVDDYLGVSMYWSHFDAKTNLKLLDRCGFEIVWFRIVPDATSPGPGHLFVLAGKRSE